jgi:ABC-type multidrug transport system ATPase subunit
MRNITVKGIRKSFSGRTVLAGAGFALSEGQRLALVGENGSGKSTLLKILCKRLKPATGRNER